jgi:cobalamin transport system ATP-binding protein
MKTAIEVSNLTCRYDHRAVVDRISFSVREGEFFIIIGPNGSGKSTLMNTVAGLSPSSGGDILIRNRPLADYPRKVLARTVAVVRQQASIDFPFTVREIVMMGRTPHQGLLGLESSTDHAAVDEALLFTDLQDLANRNIHQLSGGECQRVFIARAICQDPQIMLLDEPTAALDLAHQTRIMDLMEKLKVEKGTTIVMISHDINLASLYADTLLLIKGGQTIKQGTPDTVLTYDILEDAYDCHLLMDISPVKSRPRVTLVPDSYLRGLTENGTNPHKAD